MDELEGIFNTAQQAQSHELTTARFFTDLDKEKRRQSLIANRGKKGKVDLKLHQQ